MELVREESQIACACPTSKRPFVYFRMISHFFKVSCINSDLCLSKILTKQKKMQWLIGRFFKKCMVGDDKRTQRLRALTALLEDLPCGSIPGIPKAAHNCL